MQLSGDDDVYQFVDKLYIITEYISLSRNSWFSE